MHGDWNRCTWTDLSKDDLSEMTSAKLTSAIHFLAVGSGPGQLGDWDPNGPTAKQHIIPQGAADTSHGCVNTRPLASLKFCLTEQDTWQALWVSAAQSGIYEGYRREGRLMELDKVIQPAVTQPGIIMETCNYGKKHNEMVC